MKIKEDSSFLQGVESRLDSLFADDTEIRKDSKDDSPRSAAEEPSGITKPEQALDPAEVKPPPISLESKDEPETDFEEMTPDIKQKLSLDTTGRPAQNPEGEKSSFINEIEKRFSAIFGEDGGTPPAEETVSKASRSFQEVIAEAEVSDKRIDAPSDDFHPSGLVMASPLKNVKSVVLSLEWEISDEILEQFEEELNKVYLLYTGDKIILGFVRILRFLGRYIRVRGANSNRESINLLLSVYDQLENVMVSSEMTEVKKHLILLDNVKKYRGWVETTDLEAQSDAETPVQQAVEIEPVEAKPAEMEPLIELATEKPLPAPDADIERLSDLSLELESVDVPKPPDPLRSAETRRDWTVHEADDIVVDEPLAVPTLETPDQSSQAPAPPADLAVQESIAAIKEMAPHEAFAFALDELKKTFSGEIDALKQEIQALKNDYRTQR
jgi:hypothetical protein